MARRRAQWLKYRNRIDPSRLVFIDETWTKTNMAPLYGWAPCGQRLRAKVPHRRWKTMTFLAALRQDRVDAVPVDDLQSGGADVQTDGAAVGEAEAPALHVGVPAAAGGVAQPRKSKNARIGGQF